VVRSYRSEPSVFLKQEPTELDYDNTHAAWESREIKLVVQAKSEKISQF